MKKLSIYMMLAVAGLFMTACGPEDNEFAGLKKAEADAAVAVPGFTASQIGLIDLNTVEVSAEQDVQAFSVSETALPEGVELSKAEIVFEDGTVLPATTDGKVSGEALSSYIASIFGLRPEARSVTGTVYFYAVQNGGAVKIDAGAVTFQVVPKAPVIASAYYLTGTINGWDNSNTDFELSNDGDDPYANPTFTCTIETAKIGNPESIEFKATPIDGLGGDWSGCLAAGDEGKFNYNNDGGNFKIEGIAANTVMIRLTFNMLDQTWSYTEVAFNDYIYEIGNEGGWQTSHPLYGANSDGKYQGFYYLNGEFKFKPNEGNWDGDWGQTPDQPTGNLTADGEWNCWLDNGEGFYCINVDIAAMTWSLTKINSVFVVGSAVNNDWDTGVEMTFNTEKQCWECDATFTEAGVIKFKGNGTWDNADGNWGGTMDNIINGSNDNIPVSLTGDVHIEFYPSCDTKSYCTITAK